MTGPKAVSAYIADAPPAARKMLKQLRSVIRSAAPKAEEKLSYGMPYYGYRGRLVYFAAFKDHVSIFVMGKAQTAFPAEQKKYKHGRATLQFPLGTKLPIAFIKKLVNVRLREIEAKR